MSKYIIIFIIYQFSNKQYITIHTIRKLMHFGNLDKAHVWRCLVLEGVDHGHLVTLGGQGL